MANTEKFNEKYARVYILDNPFCIDRPFDYHIPHTSTEHIGQKLRPGTFVTVPFGRGNRKQIAVVTDIIDAGKLDPSIDPNKIKPIDSLCAGSCTEELLLSEEQLSLCFFLKEQTLCTMGEAVRTIVPPSSLSQLVEYYRPVKDISSSPSANLTSSELFVYEYICTRKTVSAQSLKNHFGKGCDAAIAKLTDKHLIEKELNLKKPSSTPTESYYSVRVPKEEITRILAKDKNVHIKLSSALQLSALSTLASADRPLSASEVCERCGTGRAQLKALFEKGLLNREERPIWRDPYCINTPIDQKPFDLNDEQTKAYMTLLSLSKAPKAHAALLHGVTGSGKTCVILALIDNMLERGKGTIVLLPEISLTPQIASLFTSRYGSRVAVLHSALSAGERLDAYTKIRRGLATVVLGTRSAVFAPVCDLGLIVIDEEQEHTYKSDMNPKYHARDIARFRCAYNSALMLLSSATPSLESYNKAVEGKYALIKMKQRYGGATLPKVRIEDMRNENQEGNVTPIGRALSEELARNFAEGNQSVLFLNRRGYSTQIVCKSCGRAITCKNCSVAMNYHTSKGNYNEGELRCHWCGSRRHLPSTCPDCSSPHLVRMGYGTQRIEQELGNIVSDATVLRMDADTTTSKFSYDDMLGKFRRHEADILLGTQMVTKGHDFPDVTLVGVLMADMSLYLDDYRAAERTFSMLTQVIGRAGRANKPGTALIQTINPDNDVIKLACEQNYETFFEREIRLRRLLVFPPFCDIVLLTLSSPDEKELNKAALRLSEEIRALTELRYSDVPLISFGPFEAPVYRVENSYRMRMVIKCRLNKRSRSLFSTILSEFASSRGTGSPTLSIDLNPSSL